MDFPAPELSTPPKLSLFSLPSKPQPDVGVTPPVNALAAAVPFLWEEAPGKPRPTAASDDPPKSKAVRSLDLPPRLAAFSPANNGNNRHRDKLGNNVAVEIIPSPTTVLGGPYEGVYASNIALESSEKMVVDNSNNKSDRNSNKGKSSMPLRKLMRKDRSPVKFRSWRWERDGFGDIDDGRSDRSPTVTFCSWRWDSFRDIGGGSDGGRGGSFNSGCKIGKIARKNSFTFENGSTSRFLANMYGTLKQAIPWRSRR
ncbi:hypothetical protein SSX86_003555 [Deinandra increscens subsp. villosa]|uniref:Uncharacterized protein n=1 Tax=Deinandra increscens subsp. villosa TaxID=3103831 RepID=A0AAP0DQ83_9ASTR